MAYSKSQIEQLWINEGGDPKAAPTAAAIALAESGGKASAINDKNSDGSIDRGLFQINSVHGAQSTTDLRKNVRAAIRISGNGKNWHPWVTFNTGAYKKYSGGGSSVPEGRIGPTRGSSATGPTMRTIPGKSLLPERQAATADFLGQRGSSASQNLSFAQQIAGLQDQPDRQVPVASATRAQSPGSPSASPGSSAFSKSHSPLLELIYNGQDPFAVKNGRKVDPGIYSAVWDQHKNHVHVAAGPKTVYALGKLAQQMGLNVGENPRFGGVSPVHVANSYHYKGEAIDVSGTPKKMESFAKEIEKLYKL